MLAQTMPLVAAMQADPLPAAVSIPCPAQQLPPQKRQELALQVLDGSQPVAQLARQHQVSRQFLYRQADTAQLALDHAFDPPPAAQEVLFHLPVTTSWLRQLILTLVLACHSPYRGVIALLRDLFDTETSLGTVHNVVQAAVARARAINDSYDLAAVRVGAHDEIFQAGHPVLVGVDTASTFCYLLSQEEHRDADTWAVRLLELAEHGFAPDAIVADFGTGLRAGQALALPQVPCRGDVFHRLRDLEQAVSYLENRAYDALEACAPGAGAGPSAPAGPAGAGRGPATAAGPRRVRPGHRLGGRCPTAGRLAPLRRARTGRAVPRRPPGVVRLHLGRTASAGPGLRTAWGRSTGC